MSAAFTIAPNESGNDLVITTAKGTLVALVYRVPGNDSEAATQDRASIICGALSSRSASGGCITRERLIEATAPDFVTCEDGFAVYWPDNRRGGLTPWMLRTLADEIDQRNSAWAEQIDRDLSAPAKAA